MPLESTQHRTYANPLPWCRSSIVVDRLQYQGVTRLRAVANTVPRQSDADPDLRRFEVASHRTDHYYQIMNNAITLTALDLTTMSLGDVYAALGCSCLAADAVSAKAATVAARRRGTTSGAAPAQTTAVEGQGVVLISAEHNPLA